VERLKSNPHVQTPRHCGTILAFEVMHKHDGYLSPVAPWFYDYCLKNNILLRPLGNTIYILPPYIITADQLQKIYNTIEQGLSEYLGG
jgi:adenosylmethionine-8-amino-7-oxononanoate aminotransferase